MEKKHYQMMIVGIIGIAVVVGIHSYLTENYFGIIIAIIGIAIFIGIMAKGSESTE